MNPASPFLERQDSPLVDVSFDGAPLRLSAGMNLAAALLLAGVDVFRHTPTSGAPRAPFCMMGACFECLLDIDGVATQACMIEVTEGLQIMRPKPVGGHDDQT